MSHLTFDIPDDLALQLGPDDRHAGAEVRTMAAVKLFELGRPVSYTHLTLPTTILV